MRHNLEVVIATAVVGVIGWLNAALGMGVEKTFSAKVGVGVGAENAPEGHVREEGTSGEGQKDESRPDSPR